MLRLTKFLGLLGLADLVSKAALAPLAPLASPAVMPFRPGSHRRHGRLYSTRSNRPGRQRLKPAIVGGNWKGVEYLTYAEHDQCNRVARQMNLPYEQVKAALLIERRAA